MGLVAGVLSSAGEETLRALLRWAGCGSPEPMSADLPIQAVLPELLAALRESRSAVLVAPPGAGKTTAVAPALISEDWCTGQVILLSPRRVAARAASRAGRTA